MSTEEKKEDEDVIEIVSVRYVSDWYDEPKHKIVLKDIIGFEIDWRADSWHVVVVTNQETNNENIYAPKYYSYDLSHWVSMWEVAKLIANPKAKIRKIGNLHNSKNFYKELQKLFAAAQKIENQ